MDKKISSLSISGISKTTGGEYEDIDVCGMAKFDGDIKCSNMNISGTCKTTGNLKCNDIDICGMSRVNGNTDLLNASISGTAKFKQNIKCSDINISGIANIGSNLECREIEVSGISKVRGNIKFENINLAGILKVKNKAKGNKIEGEGILKIEKDIECENIKLDGSLISKESINCEVFNLKMMSRCKCSEIGASNINISPSENDKKVIISFINNKKFTSKLIEGDDIYLENCKIKLVRGKNIKIGPNCKIDKIEYTNNYSVDESSKVKQTTKL